MSYKYLTSEQLTDWLSKHDESDWSVRLKRPGLRDVIIGILWFHGRDDCWKVRFLAPTDETKLLVERREFAAARTEFINRVNDYLTRGRQLTKIESGYPVVV